MTTSRPPTRDLTTGIADLEQLPTILRHDYGAGMIEPSLDQLVAEAAPRLDPTKADRLRECVDELRTAGIDPAVCTFTTLEQLHANSDRAIKLLRRSMGLPSDPYAYHFGSGPGLLGS